MIRIVLLGRTGNNMFQYALGRVLARKHGVPLVLDGSWFNNAGWAEVSHFLSLPLKARVVRRCSLGARLLNKLSGRHYWEYRGVPVLKEKGDDQSFDPRFLEAPGDCVLFGYFQTSWYFKSIETELRAELNSLMDLAVRIEGQEMKAPGVVAVHVRRTDYLNHAAFQVCDRAYYEKSINRMRDEVPGASFHIFSDDPEWCRQEFRDADQVVMDSSSAGENPLHDLKMMSLASHHIIANSSYSWWAAWLGEKRGQQVIMPERWYAHGIKAPIEEKRW